jgi:polyphosphate kinase
VDSPDAPDEPRLLNRELSWLEFNARVLALAEDADRPLLERAKFLAIFATNLDEFVQVRVSGLQEQVTAGIRTRTPDGMDPLQQLRAISLRMDELVTRHAELFTKEIAPALEDVGIAFSKWDELDDDDREYLVEVFDASVFPVLTPLAVDPPHPIPKKTNH